MNNYLKTLIAVILIMAAGYGIGRFTAPEKIIEKEKKIEVEVEKEVVKEVEVIKEVIVENKNVNTKTTIIEYPDGRKETITEIIDKTTIETGTDSEKNIDSERDSVVSSESSKEKITINKKPQWKVLGLAGIKAVDFGKPIYGGALERRVFGPFYIGAWGLSDGTAGIGAGFEF